MHFDFNKNFANKQTNKTPKITLFEEKKNDKNDDKNERKSRNEEETQCG